MDTNKYKKYDYIFYLIFISIPLIDTINGMLIANNISISIGQMYRFFIFILIILILIKVNIKYLDNILLIGIPIISLQFIHYYYNLSLIGLIDDLIRASKIILTFNLCYIYKKLKEQGKVSSDIINRIIDKLIIYFPLTVLIPYLMNLGLYIYGTGAGYKGFYSSNNELSIVLLIMSIFSLNKALNNKKMKYNLILAINIISLLVIGAKTSIIGLIVISIYYLKDIIKEYILSRRINFIIIISIIFVIFFKNDLIEMWSNIFERQEYFYNKHNSILTLILSSRDIYLNNSIRSLNQSNNIFLRILLGCGNYFRENNIIEGKMIEMDIFDIFFNEGIIFTCVLIALFFKIYKDACNVGGEYDFKLAFLIICGFGFLAGHVIYGALAGNILSLIIMGIIGKKTEGKERNEYCKNSKRIS